MAQLRYVLSLGLLFICVIVNAQDILVLYTAKHDQAHISFVNEANRWLKDIAGRNGLSITTSTDWSKLNTDTLRHYELVVFLDTRPEQETHRKTFERYMKEGGAWIGFHFAAFALTPSSYPQNWNWYHDRFLGTGEYASNTWRPTAATLRVEIPSHPIAKQIPEKFTSSPNEWYRWKNDLRTNPDIKILVSIDPVSFPLGTGPKPHEIWHEGYYPVVWTNVKYRMVYFNMGHNDIDYEGGGNRELSFTFGNPTQDRLIENAMLWLVGK